MALNEIEYTEIESKDPLFRVYKRVFECLEADLTMGDEGWTCTGLPVEGDDYPYGTFKIVPTCFHVRVLKKDPENAGKGKVEAFYRGYRPFPTG
jgi:hypothetical protein